MDLSRLNNNYYFIADKQFGRCLWWKNFIIFISSGGKVRISRERTTIFAIFAIINFICISDLPDL